MRQQGVDDDDDLVGVGGSTRRVNDNGDGGDDNDMDGPTSSSSRHQKFLSFLNPLYKVSEEQLFNDFSFELGEIIINVENDLDYEEELSGRGAVLEEEEGDRGGESEWQEIEKDECDGHCVLLHVPVKLEVNP